MGLHHQANHGKVFRGIEARNHLQNHKRDSHGSNIKMNVPDNASPQNRGADRHVVNLGDNTAPQNRGADRHVLNLQNKAVETVNSVVYVTLDPTFSGSVAGYTTIDDATSTAAAATSTSNPDEDAYNSAKAAASNRGHTSAASATATSNPDEDAYNSAKAAASNRGNKSATSSTVLVTPTPSTSDSVAQITQASSTLAEGHDNKNVFLNPPSSATATALVGGAPQATRSASADSSHSGMTGGAQAGVAIGVIAAVAMIAGLFFFCWRRRKNPAAKEEIYDEKRTSSIFGGNAMNEKRQSAGSDKAPSDRSSIATATAPRLSLRPVTQFLPNLASDKRKSNGDSNLDPAAAAMSEKPKSMWERRSNTTENPFADGQQPTQSPFDEPEGKEGAKVDAAANGSVDTAAQPAANNVHRVQLDFKPSMDDELELKSGQLVRVLHEYDDGWALCIRMDRSQQGVAPRTCLSKMPVKPRGPPSNGSNGPAGTPQGPAGMVPRPLTPQSREPSTERADEPAQQSQQGSAVARKPVPGQAM
ncbi:hypothetical protein D0863_04131 [Hortaea werneckii]|uniref:SH3 domain-containing protein n=1 Tax=Hortaea werneckii TaxID=91943 RepID=A0A3M7E939_HORWE|nr:hypothetical protein D0863_04131 [Hortaea werneckii]